MAEEHENGNLATDQPENDNGEEPMIGPGPVVRCHKRPLQFEQAFLDALPSAHMYEKSYMHRDVVTHVAVSAAEFFITGSADGHLKFWKKNVVGFEFVNHFRAHLGPIEGLSKMCRSDYSKQDVDAKVERPIKDTPMEGEQQQEVVEIN